MARRSKMATEEPTVMPTRTGVLFSVGAWTIVMFAGDDEVGDAMVRILELDSERVVDVAVGGIVVVLRMVLVLVGGSVLLELNVVGMLEVVVLVLVPVLR
jgi:hypothetical protein